MGAEILAVRVGEEKTDTKQIKTQGHDRVTCFLDRGGCQGGPLLGDGVWRTRRHHPGRSREHRTRGISKL